VERHNPKPNIDEDSAQKGKKKKNDQREHHQVNEGVKNTTSEFDDGNRLVKFANPKK